MGRKEEIKNKNIISRLVRDYFGLDEKSFDLFNYNLFCERDVADEYKFVHENNDLRAYFNLEDVVNLDLENNSSIFSIFKDFGIFANEFLDEIRKFNITYHDYKNNILVFEKNTLKLLKFFKKAKTIHLLKKYFEKPECIFTKEISDRVKKLNYRSHQHEIDKIFALATEVNSCLEEEDNNYINFFNYYETMIKNITRITKLKGPKSEVKFVVSRNFADYFLCSTNQSFKSCLNLDSEFEGALWSGLPGLITDKNRALVYVANPNDTIEYKGIVAPKMIGRSWILTSRIKSESIKNLDEKEKYFIHFVRSYPNDGMDNVFKSSLSKIFPNRTIIQKGDKDCDKLVGRYYFKPLYHEDGKTCFIYQDTTSFKLGKKNKAKLNNYVYYDSFTSSGKHIALDERGNTRDSFKYSGGLPGLIEKEINIVKADENGFEGRCCSACGSHNDVEYSDVLDGNYCSNCRSERTFYCYSCGDECHIDDSYRGAGEEYYCSDCFHDRFNTCDICGNPVNENDTIATKSQTYCPECAERRGVRECESCNESLEELNQFVINERVYCHDCSLEVETEEQETTNA